MQKNQNALFIGYANLEDLAEAIEASDPVFNVADNVEPEQAGGPLHKAPVFGMVSAVSQVNFPITRLTAMVQVVDTLNRVHYWRMSLGEHFTGPFTQEEKSISQNATFAWAVIVDYLGKRGVTLTLGQVAAPKDLALLDGHFAGLKFSEAELWHVPAATHGAGNATG